jgi:hypothetical protein
MSNFRAWVQAAKPTSSDRRMAQDGYSNARRPQTLSEGYNRKGGLNPPTSQVQIRPPAPAPMNPGATPRTPPLRRD